MLSYSVLSPLAGAVTGPLALGAISGVVSAVLFERILVLRVRAHRVVGRDLVRARNSRESHRRARDVRISASRSDWPRSTRCNDAGRCSQSPPRSLCALSSPLAGAFLALGDAAWALSTTRPARRGDRSRDRRARAARSHRGAVSDAAANHTSRWALAWDLGLCLAIAIAAWRVQALRWGAALYAIAAVYTFMVATPLGGNVGRLAAIRRWSVLRVHAAPRPPSAPRVARGPAADLAVVSTINGVATHAPTRRPSSRLRPVRLVPECAGRPIGASRFRRRTGIGKPRTRLHTCCRGWERQLDIAYNPIFYNAPLNATSYQQVAERERGCVRRVACRRDSTTRRSASGRCCSVDSHICNRCG